MNVADESDKVTDVWIKRAQYPRRIGLRIGCIGKIADRFEADHGGDRVAARFASTAVNVASHSTQSEIRRLFVHERYKQHRVLRLSVGQAWPPNRPCRD